MLTRGRWGRQQYCPLTSEFENHPTTVSLTVCANIQCINIR